MVQNQEVNGPRLHYSQYLARIEAVSHGMMYWPLKGEERAWSSEKRRKEATRGSVMRVLDYYLPVGT